MHMPHISRHLAKVLVSSLPQHDTPPSPVIFLIESPPSLLCLNCCDDSLEPSNTQDCVFLKGEIVKGLGTQLEVSLGIF